MSWRFIFFLIAFITGLLNNIGTHVDPILLINRIKEGMEIPNLRDSLVKILHDYNLQVTYFLLPQKQKKETITKIVFFFYLLEDPFEGRMQEDPCGWFPLLAPEDASYSDEGGQGEWWVFF